MGLDALTERSHKISGSNVKTTEVQQQLQRLDVRLKQQQKQRKLEPLFERLNALEVCVARAGQQGSAYRGFGGLPGFPPAMPGMFGPPGMLGAPGIGGFGMGLPPGMG